MFNRAKKYLFYTIADKQLKTIKRERKFVNYNNAKTILLLFESDLLEENSAIKKVIKILKKDNKKVVSIGFINKKEVTTPVLPEFKLLTKQDINFFEKPNSAIISELQNNEFDLLIDFNSHSNLTIEYLNLYAKAFCKIGFRRDKLDIYDFIMELEKININEDGSSKQLDELDLFNQIIFYLKSIQSND